MNFTFKSGALLVGLIALGVFTGLQLNQLVNKAKMPPPAKG